MNVGLNTVVDFLQKKGISIEADPNLKISDDQYELLKQEFSKDQDLKQKSERFIQDRQIRQKEAQKEAQAKAALEKPVEAAPVSQGQKYKPLGHIDLENALEHGTSPKPVETVKPAPVVEVQKEVEQPKEVASKPAPEPIKVIPEVKEAKTEEAKPQVEEKILQPEPKKVEATVQQAPKPEPVQVVVETPKASAPVAAKEDEVFKLEKENATPTLNVIGHVDLDALNQSTRPKKKSKEERKKEREEKEQARLKNRTAIKAAIIKEISHDDSSSSKGDDEPQRKKRARIGKEKVDINSAGANIPRGMDRRRQDNQQDAQGKRQRDRFSKKSPVKQEINDEDVAKQVKETLARLTSKPKNKGAKYRKEKRELASNRLMEQEDLERQESQVLKLTEFVTANELASMMDVPVTQVIATCMSVGIMVSINQRLDAETINLVAEEFGYSTEYVSAEVSQAIVEEADEESDLLPRAPIVTVMGHVDHGKTSLLDYIRKSNVIAGEAGGITQHIGAYNVRLEDGRKITFLDTPGHEAFTAMRARGAKVTDIAIIIVAADDSVMPQTKEAINHATAAGVPIVFAINKIDKPAANPDKIKEELAALNFLVEDWGGKYQSQDISAKKGIGVPELMEKVLLEAEILDLKANPNRKATGSIIESSLDKGRGYVATVLVSNGTLKVGDIVLAGSHFGRVKAMFNERNQRITSALPSEPALILGLNGAPAAGDTFHVIDTDQEAREIASKREQLQREQGLRTQKMLTLDEVGRRLALGDFHELNIIVKGDVDGSVEALSDSLIKLSTDKIQVNVIHQGVGQISESDVSLAAASNAIIVGFQVRPSAGASRLAEQEGVDIRKYSIIYDAIEEVKAAMEGMLAPTLKEQVTATIEVREVFNISKVGMVAGAMVKTGKVKRTDRARLIRDGIVIFTGSINALKRFKDDVKEVLTNFECGISLNGCNDLKVGDVIETYEEIEVKQTL